MNKKITLILIFSLVFLCISAIIYYIAFYSVEKPENVTSNPIDTNTQNIAEIETEKITPLNTEPKTIKPVYVKPPVLPIGQNDIERMAKSFAERFGSFSNQSNFSNIVDLKIFMTPKMKTWAEDYVNKNKKSNVAAEVYYGITTKALSAVTKEFDEEKELGAVMVQTRRREAVGSTNNSSKLYNQEILIQFVKENGVWKVDSAVWQN